jgi:hypothetical protein
LHGSPIESDPQIAEENPGDLVKAVTEFLGDPAEQLALWEATGT